MSKHAPMNVAVVGAGIMGACIAFHLVRLGVRVHCVERGRPGGGTTDTSFARLSAYQQPTPTGFLINTTGIAEYTHLARILDLSPFWHPCGSMAWTRDDCDQADGRTFHDCIEQMREWGYQVRWCDAQEVNRSLDPRIRFPTPSTPVALLPQEGWVDAPALAEALLRRRAGLLAVQHAAEAVVCEAGRVRSLRLDDGTQLPVDAVVNAAGLGALALATTAPAPVPALAQRSSLVVDLATTAPAPPWVLRAPDVQIRSAGPGRLRIRSDQVDSQLADPPVPPGPIPRALVDDLLDRARACLPDLAEAETSKVRICTGVFPHDGLPAVGEVSAVHGYYEAVTDRGVTLGPLLGRLLAEFIVTGNRPDLLAHCRPDRLRESGGKTR
ncbi:NAD(P)/FAD-dependent oxidoreductase [Streptomyces sp. NPDC002952]|uniref:NAD(P)/FAD-dependent oxidoreductase n=1 Tax=Streptomyces sp. NPDC002952 TaxID=3364673 RepID=UPI0036928A9B